MPDETQNPAVPEQGDIQVEVVTAVVEEPAQPAPVAADPEPAPKNKGGRPPNAAKKAIVLTPDTGISGLVKFLSRVPHQVIDIGDQKVEFQHGVAEVETSVADRLRAHHLFSHGHIFDGRTTIRLGNDFVDLDKESPAVREALRNPSPDVTIFVFTESPNTRISMGDATVQFHMGKAVVTDKKVADRLERHMFFVQGRMTKLSFN